MELSSTDARSGVDTIRDLLKAFFSFTARLIQVDISTMESAQFDSGAEPDLISGAAVKAMQWMDASNVPLYVMMHQRYDHESSEDLMWITNTFVKMPVNGLRHFQRFSELLLEWMRFHPRLIGQLWPIIDQTNRMIDITVDYRMSSMEADDAGPLTALLLLVPSQAAVIFRSIDAGLQLIVDKHNSVLQKNDSGKIIEQLSRLVFSLAQTDEKIARSFFEDKVGGLVEADPKDYPQIIAHAFKFSMYKKYITGGRMDLRVQGILKMVDDLLQAFHNWGQQEGGIYHPVMQHLAEFILNNKLVDYIVGVGSHPELIHRSGNIVGFLVVTNKYTEEVSDAIWSTVATSQDPRVVAAVLNMLKDVQGNMILQPLLHLCNKVRELPFSYFDLNMVEYARHVITTSAYKFRQHGHPGKLPPEPYRLAIRLMRQASSQAEDALPTGNNLVWDIATTELKSLVDLGPSAEDRRLFYEECVLDIQNKSVFATGSICAINIFLCRRDQYSKPLEIGMMVDEMNLAKVFVDDWSHAVERERKKGGQRNYHVVRSRIDLFSQLLYNAPDAITACLDAEFWAYLVGEKALHADERNYAWTIIAHAAATAGSSRNVFVDMCFKDYLPTLDPKYFHYGILAFVQKVIEYEVRLKSITTVISDHQIIEIEGIEQLWRLILKAPTGTIESGAVLHLVKLYFDTPLVMNSPISASDATHVALVDRCLDQLISAAQKLRAFTDGSSSGEDEPMVIVASEEEVRAEELRFTRSLHTLREILNGYRSRVFYTRRLEKEPSPIDIADIKGDPFIVHVQPYTATSSPGIKTIEVGTLDTLEDLVERIAKVAGFPKFKIFCGGAIIYEPGNPASMTLEETKIHALPSIIARKIQNGDEIEDVSLPVSLTPVEVEVLKQFDALYDLLSMEQSLAQEVSHPPRMRKAETLICSLALAIPPKISCSG
jgi:ubiquitin carboxyl-terminal hydrolase 34